MKYDEIRHAWNAQADEHNQWDELGEDEKVEWAAIHAAAKAQCEPLDEEAIERVTGVKRGTPMFLAATGFVRATERAHGITQEKQG